MQFLRVPYESSKEKANFTALATIEDTAASTSRCTESRYITSMLFEGAWFEGKPLKVSMDEGRMRVLHGGIEVKPSQEAILSTGMVEIRMPDEGKVHVAIGNEDAEVVVTRDIQPVHFFLNVQATSLGQLSSRIGGLLGEDDNADVSTLSAECREQRMLMATNMSPFSVASASA